MAIFDGDDRLYEQRRHVGEADMDVAVPAVMEDIDEVIRRVVDVRVDLGLHVRDRGGVRKLALVGVVAGEDSSDRARADRREDGDEDEDDAERAAAAARPAKVAVSAGAAAKAAPAVKNAAPPIACVARPSSTSPTIW